MRNTPCLPCPERHGEGHQIAVTVLPSYGFGAQCTANFRAFQTRMSSCMSSSQLSDEQRNELHADYLHLRTRHHEDRRQLTNSMQRIETAIHRATMITAAPTLCTNMPTVRDASVTFIDQLDDNTLAPALESALTSATDYEVYRDIPSCVDRSFISISLAAASIVGCRNNVRRRLFSVPSDDLNLRVKQATECKNPTLVMLPQLLKPRYAAYQPTCIAASSQQTFSSVYMPVPWPD